MNPPRKRRWLRFSLRSLLASFIAAALVLGYLASLWHGHQRKVALIQEVEALGGHVKVERRGPSWVRQVGAYHPHGVSWNPAIGVFDRVVGAWFKRAEDIDGCLPRLTGFPDLKSLSLTRCGVTNGSVRHLAELTSLEKLNLSYCAITDDCMPHIGKLIHLKELDLGHTRVCGRGFHRLKLLPELEKLTLVFTPIRDDALEPLKEIPTLSLCNVWACRHLSREGIEDFQAARPDCLLYGIQTLKPHWDAQDEEEPSL